MIKEWREPHHAAFALPTGWSLFNAITNQLLYHGLSAATDWSVLDLPDHLTLTSVAPSLRTITVEAVKGGDVPDKSRHKKTGAGIPRLF